MGRELGGTGNECEFCSIIDVDGVGNIYVAGTFEDTVDFKPGPGVDNRIAEGDSDLFLVKFCPDGNWKKKKPNTPLPGFTFPTKVWEV